MPFKIVPWLLLFACLIVPTQANGQDSESDRDGKGDRPNAWNGLPISWSTPPSPGPPNIFTSGFTPVCYARLDGEARLVRPWSLTNRAAADCRPPAPWDTFNIPAGGLPNVACTGGGSLHCHLDEDYTPL